MLAYVERTSRRGTFISLLVRPGWLSVPGLAVALLSVAAQSLFFRVVLCALVLPWAWATLHVLRRILKSIDCAKVPERGCKCRG